MPPRNRKKSKVEGLFKRCEHLKWENCSCPWWGRCKQHRVSLQKWAGMPIPNKEIARKVLSRMEAAVLNRVFDPRGERAALDGSMTFSGFLDEYEKHHTQKLRSNSVASYMETFRKEFGQERLAVLAASPFRFERWLNEQQSTHQWADATYNRHLEHLRAMFNWAKARRLVTENPMDAFEAKPEHNKRNLRVTPEQEQKLLLACELLDARKPSKLVKVTPEVVADIRASAEAGELQKDIAQRLGVSRPLVSQIVTGKVWNTKQPTVGPEMKRRLIAALDLGLREGEMLLLQVKHVDFETWTVKLPAEITKAGTNQQVFAGTERLRDVLEERKSLGPDAYVFGRESGHFVASFDKSWRKLFKLAGLPVGRKSGYVWHDLRHEYGSFLIEQGATIQEAKEMMRHADIRTTARYLKAKDERLRELAAKMGQRTA